MEANEVSRGSLRTRNIHLADGEIVQALLVALCMPFRSAYSVFTVDSGWRRIDADDVQKIEDGEPFEIPPAWLD